MASVVESEGSVSFSMRMAVYGIQKVFPSVRNVTCDQVERWRKSNSKKLVCVDVRPEEEYGISHMPGAVRVDPSSEPPLQTLGITSDSTVVCYCSVGYRSSDLAKKLHHSAKQTGLSLDVYNMEGGVFQWAIEGREIVDSDGEKASVVHPYNSVFGKLLPWKLRAHL